MNSVIITLPAYTAYDPRLNNMLRWCFDTVGVEHKDWDWRWIGNTSYDFEFTFKKNKVATMFRLKFYNE
jgi:hypothetical protein